MREERVMEFFFLKEWKERKEQRAKELEEKRNAFIKENMKYCDWLSAGTKVFLNELEAKGFKASWGFEVSPCIGDFLAGIGGKQYDDKYIFDVPDLRGMAFDADSRQMLYVTCKGGLYNNFIQDGDAIKYEYSLIPFEKISGVKVDVDSTTIYETNISNGKVISRSLAGGLLGGGAGAIIGGMTASKNACTQETKIPKKIKFTIHTLDMEYPIISFKFKSDKKWLGDTDIADIMYGLFSDTEQYFSLSISDQNRTGGSKVDCFYDRSQNIPLYDENKEEEYQPIMDYIACTCHLEDVEMRLEKYAMQIQSIIQQNSIDNKNEDKNRDIISEITKLAEMKEKGLITEEEFIKLKAQLI
jgi:hypothetical protein